MSLSGAAIIFLVTMCASFIQRVTGFGFGIVFMTVAPFIMPTYAEAVALSSSLAIVNASITGVQFIKHIPWKKLSIILITFLIVSFFSVRFVGKVDGYTMKKVLGALLILVSIYFFFLSGKIRLKPSATTQISLGTISGLMGGIFSMQGPPAVIYFISCTDRKEEYMAMTQWYFIIGNIAMTIFRAGNGMITANVKEGWLAGLAAIFIGISLGALVYKKVPVQKLKKLVYTFIGVSGLAAIVL